MNARARKVNGPDAYAFCKYPLPQPEILELFPRPAPSAQQLEMVSIARDLKRRYAGATREVVLELDRTQVEAMANAIRAHQTGRPFYRRLGACVEVMESIVLQWCAAKGRSEALPAAAVARKPDVSAGKNNQAVKLRKTGI